MSRRRHHEEHQNHEAWAIPYGDLVTLLLAFFVVMYSISQVNEGKYRVVSDALNAAFRGEPTTTLPIQLGNPAATTTAAPTVQLPEDMKMMAMRQLAQETEAAMSALIQQGLVDVSSGDGKLSIAIRSDILFTSGSATLSASAIPVIQLLGETLRGFPVGIEVEGHTDNVPVRSGAFPSNWELSAGRAASVVHLLIDAGVNPTRLSAVAYGEYRPVLPNVTVDGRNANRRVVLQVEATDPPEAGTAGTPDAAANAGTADTAGAAGAGATSAGAASPVAPALPANATTAASPGAAIASPNAVTAQP